MPEMRAVQVSKGNAPFEVVERDLPEPDPTQVRIKVDACGIAPNPGLIDPS
jgi:D-arabinose 1-dehydrogenase-like Zn-dependent alcohol dehydrogenase